LKQRNDATPACAYTPDDGVGLDDKIGKIVCVFTSAVHCGENMEKAEV
jgi:hypothetical protein